MPTIRNRGASWLLCALLSSLIPLAAAGADKRLAPLSPPGPSYGKHWALVVGINYNSSAERSKPQPLHRAEGDAKAFYNLLLQNYGYTVDTAKLVLGAAATKEAIEKDLSESFLCHPEEVGDRDSVLFFFSGHGYLRKDREGKSEAGTLFPDNVEFTGNNEPISAKTIDMKWVVEHLSQSKARHKLVILDCCHSGAIFDQFSVGAGRPASPFDERLDREVFQVPGFQALSASRKWQEAIDGPAATRGESEEEVADPTRPVSTLHSPFSYALIRALQTIPRRHGLNRPIMASSLFRSMRADFRYDPPHNQTPQCQWLSAEQGEFHFFPRGEFPDDAIPDERAQRMLVAMVPGVFGNWWFEETPWLMPSLREEIVKQVELKRSTDLQIFDRGSLRRAAQQAIGELRTYEDERIQRRAAHLDALLQGAETDRVKTFQRLVTELKQITSDGTAGEPVDLHFLAVLMQFLDEARDDVNVVYQAAIARYEQEAQPHPRYMPLLALCYADYGWFLHQWMHRYEDAAAYFHRARRGVFADKTPVPFQVFTLSREAFAYLELGRWHLADETLKEAIELAEQFDPAGAHPFVAATYSRRAWASMQQWEIGEAKMHFENANKVLARFAEVRHDEPQNYELLTARFHNDHGLAMAQRFGGNALGALATYRRLSPEIAIELDEHIKRAAGNDPNFTEVHHRMAERWVNTLERQGDCCLFGDQPDYGEAADDYRRALVSCDALAKNRQADWRVRLLYKRAIALSMPSPVQDAELAQGLCRLADQVLKDEVLSLEKQPAAVRFQAKLAAALVAVAPEGEAQCPAAICDSLREIIRAQMRERSGQRNIPRDELESLMFAAKTLLDHETDRARIEQVADWLLAFCRLARSTETLGYLRPYYEAVMRAKLRMKPKHVKDLIEIAAEATQGDAYRKPDAGTPLLTLFSVGDECFLFLDTPRGLSKFYSLKEYADPATVQKACLTGRLLPVPQELRRDLATMPQAWRTRLAALERVAVHWEDPVRGLEATELTPSGDRHHARRPIVGSVAETAPALASAGGVFPFDLAELAAD